MKQNTTLIAHEDFYRKNLIFIVKPTSALTIGKYSTNNTLPMA